MTIEELRARIEKLQELANMAAAGGEDMRKLLEAAGLGDILKGSLRNVFQRLYEDALRRMRKYAELLEKLRKEGMGPVLS